ncbi:MAG: transposase [Candidatus Cryosericum sp.]
MPRTARVTVADGFYHVTARGNGDEMIFATDSDKRVLLNLLGMTVVRDSWEIAAYCVMGNHYHLVVRTPLMNLSHGMHAMNGSYGEMYNGCHEHRGHVFQGRFFSVPFASDSHLLEACRYTVLNPVRAGLVASPDDWQWSSYAASAFGRHETVPVADQMLLSMLGGREENESRGVYREFVHAGLGIEKPRFLVPSRAGRQPVVHAATDGSPSRRLTSDELMAEIRRMRSEGKTLREIADLVGVSAMTIERCLKRSSSVPDLSRFSRN